MVVPPRTAAPVGECSIVRQYHSEVLINAQTGQVELSQKQMSGNATNQASGIDFEGITSESPVARK